MRLKISSKRALSAVILAGLALPVGFLFYFISKGPVRNGAEVLTGNTTAPYEQERARPGLPIRLKIPNINVDAPIEHVGLAPDGAAHLNLITCEGAWDKVSRTYSQRLVVFTDRE